MSVTVFKWNKISYEPYYQCCCLRGIMLCHRIRCSGLGSVDLQSSRSFHGNRDINTVLQYFLGMNTAPKIGVAGSRSNRPTIFALCRRVFEKIFLKFLYGKLRQATPSRCIIHYHDRAGLLVIFRQKTENNLKKKRMNMKEKSNIEINFCYFK